MHFTSYKLDNVTNSVKSIFGYEKEWYLMWVTNNEMVLITKLSLPWDLLDMVTIMRWSFLMRSKSTPMTIYLRHAHLSHKNSSFHCLVGKKIIIIQTSDN